MIYVLCVFPIIFHACTINHIGANLFVTFQRDFYASAFQIELFYEIEKYLEASLHFQRQFVAQTMG